MTNILSSNLGGASALLLMLGLAICSCDKHNDTPVKEAEQKRISWSIQGLPKGFTKAKGLIENSDGLTLACTPTNETYNGEYGLGKSIGFWVDYTTYEGERIVDFFDSANTNLIHSPKVGSPSMWNYAGDDKYWTMGGTYHVRTFFPQTMSSEIIASTIAPCFVLSYNTHLFQEDLLVAYNRVNTVDPVSHKPSVALASGNGNVPIESQITTNEDGEYGYDQEFHLDEPIPLFFQHGLSAIRVRFCYEYDDDVVNESDELMSCYMTNALGSGLHTVGLLVFGDDQNEVIENDTREALEERWKTFNWISYLTTNEFAQFYEWGVANNSAPGSGIPFSFVSNIVNGQRLVENTMAVAYSDVDLQVHRVLRNGVIQSEEEVGGTRTLTMAKEEAPFYNENDGWLLIIPQLATNDLTLHFRTRDLGEHSVKLGNYTGTNIDGDVPAPGEDNYYVAGRRYTYTVKINATDYSISLSIAPWEEIYSIEDIEL